MQYEYYTLGLRGEANAEDDVMLNEWGANGWRVVAIHGHHESPVAYLERSASDTKAGRDD